jgi:hypothetical protein
MNADNIITDATMSLPACGRAVRGSRGVIRLVAGACPARRWFSVYFLACKTQKEDEACALHLASSVSCLKPIKRRQFDRLVERHAGDAYVKSFTSWTHLLALVYAQFSSAVSPRGLESGLERQPPVSLPPGQRSAGPPDPGRCSRPVARCGCHRMNQGSISPTLCTLPVTVTTPLGCCLL